MENQVNKGTHPILIIAAVAVILFSAVGTGAIMGWIPTGNAKVGESAALVASTPAAVPSPAAPVTTSASTPAPKTTRPAVNKAATERRVIAHQDQADTPQRKAESRTEYPEARVSPQPVAAVQVAQARQPCYDCGVIESVREVEKAGDAGGLGAVAGGVAGGVLGNQVGAGRGRDIMTVVGAIGGALAGHQIEKNVKKAKFYEIVVRFEDGTTRTLSQANAPSWRPGDHVKIQSGELVSNT